MTAPWRTLKRLGSFVLVVVALIGGCDMASPYRTVIRDQVKALDEVENILSTIKDKDSMAAAQAQLVARFEQFESIQTRARNMTPPSPDITHQVLAERGKLEEATQKVVDQVRRINVLPGGPDFFRSLASKPGFRGGPRP